MTWRAKMTWTRRSAGTIVMGWSGVPARIWIRLRMMKISSGGFYLRPPAHETARHETALRSTPRSIGTNDSRVAGISLNRRRHAPAMLH
jgi:hypothetical protein